MSGLGAVFKAAMTLDGGLDVLDDEDELEWVTELEKFSPTRVDGVSGPANGVPVLLMKSTGARGGRPGVRVRARMVKSRPEQRFSLHVAYPVSKLDVSVAQDGFRDFAGADAIEQGAWEFMKSGQQIGLFHEDGTGGAGTLVESSIWRGPEYSMTAADGSRQTIAPGDWIIGIQWTPEAWALVKTGVINGVSMQGTATRRKPSPEALAALRKSKRGGKKKRALEKAAAAAHKARRDAIARQVDRALAEILAEQFAEVRKQGADLNERVNFLGRQRGFAWAEQPTGGLIKGEGLSVDAIEVQVRKARKRAQKAGARCTNCGKFSKLPGAHFCSKCGFQVGGAAKADGPGAARARCSGCGLLASPGASDCGRCGYKLGAASPGEGSDLDKSYTCGGCASKVHAERGACPFCGQVRKLGKSAAPVLTGAEEMRLAAVLRKARSTDSDERLAGIGELVEKLGTETAVKIIGGDLVTPEQFTRAYLSQRRAPQSAPAGATPRIPDTTHTVSSEDFTRAPLEPGHQRPSQVLERLNSLMQPGQAAYYRASPGIASASPYDPAAGAPSGSTVSPGLARARAAQGAFSRPPMPGDTTP